MDQRPAPEAEETNYIEAEAGGDRGPGPGAQTPSEHQDRKQLVSTEQMSKDASTSPRVDLLRDVTAVFSQVSRSTVTPS